MLIFKSLLEAVTQRLRMWYIDRRSSKTLKQSGFFLKSSWIRDEFHVYSPLLKRAAGLQLTVCVLILFDKLLPWRNVGAIMNPLQQLSCKFRASALKLEQNVVHWILFGGFRTKASPEKCSAKWEGTCCAQWFFWAKRALLGNVMLPKC